MENLYFSLSLRKFMFFFKPSETNFISVYNINAYLNNYFYIHINRI